MDFGYILRQFIGKFPAQLPACYDRKQDKLLFRKGLDHTMDPAGHPAHHIWVAPFCYNTDSHCYTSSMIRLFVVSFYVRFQSNGSIF